MIEFYTAATSNGMRAAIALAESGLRHTLHKVDLSKEEQKTAAYRAINPAALIPALVDKDVPGAPLVLTESMAILHYVAEKSGKLLPTETKARARVLEAMALAMTDVYCPFNALFHMLVDYPGGPPAEIDKGFDGMIRAALARFDERLAKSEWVAGDFSIADIALYANVWRLKTAAALQRTYPELKNVQRWYDAVAARPGVQLGHSLAGRP
jgi:glutathione S-transferase